MLLFRLFGLFLLRNEAAAFSTLLFHEPPRKTRPGHLTREPRADSVYHKAPARENRDFGGRSPPNPPVRVQRPEHQSPELRKGDDRTATTRKPM